MTGFEPRISFSGSDRSTNCATPLPTFIKSYSTFLLLTFSLARNALTQVPTTQIRAVKDSLEFLDLTEVAISVLRNHDFHGMASLKKLLINNLR